MRHSINTNNTTGAIAAVLSALQDKLDFNQAVTGLAAKLADISFTQNIGNAILAGVGGAPGVAISAGVVVADSTNLANAFVGPLGDITAGGNVTISATARRQFQVVCGRRRQRGGGGCGRWRRGRLGNR